MTGMRQESHYDVLGVPESASREEIREAYLRLAKRWHPDAAADVPHELAHDRFHRVQEAYRVLGTESSRMWYDKLGVSAAHAPSGPPSAYAAAAAAQANATSRYSNRSVALAVGVAGVVFGSFMLWFKKKRLERVRADKGAWR